MVNERIRTTNNVIRILLGNPDFLKKSMRVMIQQKKTQ